MKTTRFIASGLLAIVLNAGCGKSNDSSPDGSPVTTDDVTSYQQLAVRVQDGATNYRSRMMGSGIGTVADCRRVHDQYDAEVRPWVSELVQMSGRMDRYMTDHGGANVADYGCVSATMMYELDRHHALACTSSDLSADQVEAGRHADAMLSYGGHMWDRCDQMMRGIDGGNWGWGPMMGGCEDWDGTCSGMMHDDCRGGMMGMHGCCDW